MEKKITISTSSELTNAGMALEYEPEESTLMAISLYAKLMLVGENKCCENLN